MKSMDIKTIAAIVDFANIFLGWDTSLSTYCYSCQIMLDNRCYCRKRQVGVKHVWLT